jgi:hypothetical protein
MKNTKGNSEQHSNENSETEKRDLKKEKELHSKCGKLGVTFETPLDNETEIKQDEL